MYCEECGKKIDSDAIYCEHCGHKISNDEISLKPPISKKESKYLFLILIFVLFGFLFFQELKYFNSPENAIRNYMKSWKSKNYDVILSKLNIEASRFVSVESFQKAFQNEDEFKVVDFQIDSCDYQNNENEAICYVRYQTIKNGPFIETSYKLVKNASNRMVIFADWKVQDDTFHTVKDWNIYLPENSKGNLSGIDLSEYRFSSNDKTGYDCYKIPIIFAGEYFLQLSISNGITVNKTISVSNNEYTYRFHLEDISEEFKKHLTDLGISLVETIYQGISKKLVFGDLKVDYNISNLKSYYEELLHDTKDVGLVNFSVKEMRVSDIELKEDGKLYLSYQMNYEYDLNKSDGEKTFAHHGASNDTFYVTVTNMELSEIEKVDSLVTYFSRKH